MQIRQSSSTISAGAISPSGDILHHTGSRNFSLVNFIQQTKTSADVMMLEILLIHLPTETKMSSSFQELGGEKSEAGDKNGEKDHALILPSSAHHHRHHHHP